MTDPEKTIRHIEERLQGLEDHEDIVIGAGEARTLLKVVLDARQNISDAASARQKFVELTRELAVEWATKAHHATEPYDRHVWGGGATALWELWHKIKDPK